MAAQKGSDIILRLADADGGSPTSFLAMAGLRTKTITLNAEQVDITNADSTNKWRQALAGAGIKSCSASGAGVFTDAVVEKKALQEYANQSHLTWQLELPSFVIFEGPYQITQMQYAGEHNGEQTWDLSLESAGEIFFNFI